MVPTYMHKKSCACFPGFYKTHKYSTTNNFIIPYHVPNLQWKGLNNIRLTCKQSRADSTIFDCLVSKAKRNGRITKSASEPSSVCPASARVAAAACPVLGFAGDETGVASTDLESVSLGVDGSPSDALSGAAELILSTHNQKRNP
jgi:hypothetical protein